MKRLAQRLRWWAADYAYAAYWQMRSLVAGRHADTYRTGTLHPVVVIPGIWETWSFMRPMIEVVHEAGHPVYVLEKLGTNGRPVVTSAQLVADFVAEHDLRNVLIVSHSKGGMIGKYAMALLDESGRFSRMVAVSAPFSGSRYAPFLLLPSLRALSPKDATTLMLATSNEVNARIVSVFGEFDPHIPEGSYLPGARNVMLPTGGHFRILARPETIAIVLEQLPD